jgi:hypothetical protein
LVLVRAQNKPHSFAAGCAAACAQTPVALPAGALGSLGLGLVTATGFVIAQRRSRKK